MVLLGCGALLWSASGLSALVAAFEFRRQYRRHHSQSYRVGLLPLLSGWRRAPSRWRPHPAHRPSLLFAAYALALGVAAFLVFTVLHGWTSAFFMQDKGPSLERQFVLGSAIYAILLTLLLLRGVVLRSAFLDWFALALLLLAIG